MKPTDAEVLDALRILEIDPGDIRCAYCGDTSTEWDHLRPIITNQEPTGYITEIANLVPSCGKCNQSKGKSNWRIWILSSARLSPRSRGIKNLEARVNRLERYERWREPTVMDFAAMMGPELWGRHKQNWSDVLALLKESQELASEISETVLAAIQTRNTTS